jgi:hypothetical protein
LHLERRRIQWTVVMVTLALGGVCTPGMAAERLSWQELRTAEQFVQHCPDDLNRLFGALDLSREELAPVAAAWKRGDRVAACEALVAFYREGDQSSWYRRLDVDATERDLDWADEILADRYTGQGESGDVPRTKDGHLDWSHDGPLGDFQFRLIALHRQGYLGALYGAWKRTGKTKYLERIDQDLRDWLTAADGQAAPFGTSHLEPANRMRPWAQMFFALQQEDAFRPATRLLMLASIPVHGDYLLENPARYNWTSMTQLGALLCGVCWPQFNRAGHWRDQSLARLLQNAKVSNYPDGVQKELTASYHMTSLGRYQCTADLLDQAGIEPPEGFAATLRKMWAYTAQIIRPNGTLPLNNDSDLFDHRPNLREMAKRYEEPEWLYAASNGAEGTKPTGPPSRVLPWARQLISRDGWGAAAQWSFFDFGPAGAGGHHHADHGHLSIHLGGHDLLVDSGRFAYQGKLAEAFLYPYARHTRGHNTILIDGRGQRVAPEEFRKPAEDGRHFVVSPAFDFARAAWPNYDQVRGSVTHRRSLVYLRGRGWVVVDRVPTDRPRTIEVLWHFHPACETAVDGKTVTAAIKDGPGLRVLPVADGPAWSLNVIKGQRKPYPQGWYSERYNRHEPAPCAVYRAKIDKTATFAWVLWPSDDSGQGVTASLVDAVRPVPVVNLALPDGAKASVGVPIGTGVPRVEWKVAETGE